MLVTLCIKIAVAENRNEQEWRDDDTDDRRSRHRLQL